MNLESVKISELNLDPSNARKHPVVNLDAIRGSLAKFGQQKPIVVGKNNIVLAGNGTLAAARALGWSNIQIVRTALEGPEAIAFALADNRTSELAEWDTDILSKTLASLRDIDFDLASIGFDDDFMVEAPLGEGMTNPDAVPDVVETRCKPGDLWLLGEHRLLCGDSTNVQHVERLMGGEKADMVFTDPPYRMDVEGGSNQFVGRAAAKLGEAIRHLCDFDPEAFLSSLPLVFEPGVMNSYIFCNKDLVPEYLNWAVDSGYAFNILFWKKPNAIPLGGQHRPDVEYLLFFRKAAHWNNAVDGCTYSKCLVHARENSTCHPTMKPVEMIANQLLISSNPSGVVADLFLGSGSTLIACQKTGRRCFGMELDPKYCDVILTRWEQFTGKTATLTSMEVTA